MNNTAVIIASLLNINLNNKIVALDIDNELNKLKIELHYPFVGFIKNNFDNEEYKYMSGYQKFVAMLKRYKKKQLETLAKQNYTKLEQDGQELINKLYAVYKQWDAWVFAIGNKQIPRLPKANEIQDRGKKVFNKQELDTIEALDGLNILIKKIDFNGKELVYEKILKHLKKQSINNAKSALGMSPQKPQIQIAVKRF